ncbi:uncharacterized protein C8orf74 homolog [Babylonia areolata]|uniref:uncharacterized protein C8orf74 homolog n=1 Tax=Babylonia areolata TaxID=304850 RepID=UPI003FD0EC9C
MAAIGEPEAKQIASCPDHEGRCRLAQLLDLGPYDDEGNMDRAIRVDFFYDHLRFAADKGFPWDQVCSLLQFAAEFLATATDNHITDAVQLYQAQSPNLLLALGERNYKVYTDFLFSTFFSHFQLYKYVLSHSRSQNVPEINLEVQPPVPPLSMAEAKEVAVWRYEQQLQGLQQEEEQLVTRHLQHREQMEGQMADRRGALSSKVDHSETPFTKQSLGEMIQGLLADYMQAAGTSLATEIHDVQQDLEIKLQKTSLPRPAVLGQPPRYKPKSPIQPLPKPGAAPVKGDKKNKNTNSLDKPKSPKTPKSSARSRGSSSIGSKR